MRGNSLISKCYHSSLSVKCYGYNYIFVSSNHRDNVKGISLNDSSQVIYFENFIT